jgi:hypothetical protein
MTPISSHGLSCSWGGTTMTVVSLQHGRQAGGEVDVTSFSSEVTYDPNNTDHAMVVKDVDYGVVDPGSVGLSFQANTDILALLDYVGTKRTLSFSSEDGSFSVSFGAFLTEISFDAKVGSMIEGSCTFKLTGR